MLLDNFFRNVAQYQLNKSSNFPFCTCTKQYQKQKKPNLYGLSFVILTWKFRWQSPMVFALIARTIFGKSKNKAPEPDKAPENAKKNSEEFTHFYL